LTYFPFFPHLVLRFHLLKKSLNSHIRKVIGQERETLAEGYPFHARCGCQLCALTGIQIANKKALQAIMLEGLHPVFLTLFI
jgi:hypothetical protein